MTPQNDLAIKIIAYRRAWHRLGEMLVDSESRDLLWRGIGQVILDYAAREYITTEIACHLISSLSQVKILYLDCDTFETAMRRTIEP